MLQRVIVLIGFLAYSGVALAQQKELVPTPIPTANAAQVPTSVYHSGWGFIKADGSLSGQVVTVAAGAAVKPQGDATVTLSRDLVVLATTRTDADGSFVLSGLSPGVYEIAAESADCYGIVSFQAVSGRHLGQNTTTPVMEVYASSMRRTAVDEVLQSLWAPQDGEATGRPFVGVVEPLQPAAQSQRVAIRGGAVSGQVAFANARNIPEAHVIKVFSQGQLVATAPVDSMGKFSFPASSPGPVDLVLGGSAYAAIGVELVEDATRLSSQQKGDVRLVSLASAAAIASQLVIPAAGGPPDDGSDAPPLPIGEPLPLAGPGFPMDGGFAPGGGGFSGGGGGMGGGGGGPGGGGGLGGMGGLLGIAGLAVGVTALADDDNGFTVPQPHRLFHRLFPKSSGLRKIW